MENNKDNTQYLFGFQKDKLIQWTLYWAVLGIGFFILTFLVTSTWIGVSVHEHCLSAKSEYGNKLDCVESLIKIVDDDSHSLRERNSAIWALGQLGDERARAVLEKYYTGNIPDREPYDDTLSQYEMKKALNLINGGCNLTHIVWGGKE